MANKNIFQKLTIVFQKLRTESYINFSFMNKHFHNCVIKQNQ